MFVTIRNDKAMPNIRLALDFNSIEAFRYVITIEEQTNSTVYQIWLDLKTGKSYFLYQTDREEKAEQKWIHIGTFVNSDKPTSLIF